MPRSFSKNRHLPKTPCLKPAVQAPPPPRRLGLGDPSLSEMYNRCAAVLYRVEITAAAAGLSFDHLRDRVAKMHQAAAGARARGGR